MSWEAWALIAMLFASLLALASSPRDDPKTRVVGLIYCLGAIYLVLRLDGAL